MEFCKDLADTFQSVLFWLSGPFALLGIVYRVVNIIHKAKRLCNEFFFPTPMLPLVTGGV